MLGLLRSKIVYSSDNFYYFPFFLLVNYFTLLLCLIRPPVWTNLLPVSELLLHILTVSFLACGTLFRLHVFQRNSICKNSNAASIALRRPPDYSSPALAPQECSCFQLFHTQQPPASHCLHCPAWGWTRVKRYCSAFIISSFFFSSYCSLEALLQKWLFKPPYNFYYGI